MKEIKLTVFDMAGTTVNENNVVYKTVQKALGHAGVEVDLDTVLEFGAGKEKYKAIVDILDNNTGIGDLEAKAQEIFGVFKDMLKQAYQELEVTPYDGVEELFHCLRSNNIIVVLNTGYDLKTANTLLSKLRWKVGNPIDGLITATDVITGRPSSEMIDKAMEQFKITDASRVLKAGDSIIDIEEGKNANCGMTVGVLTGAHTRKQLETAEPTLILDSLKELKEVLLS